MDSPQWYTDEMKKGLKQAQKRPGVTNAQRHQILPTNTKIRPLTAKTRLQTLTGPIRNLFRRRR